MNRRRSSPTYRRSDSAIKTKIFAEILRIKRLAFLALIFVFFFALLSILFADFVFRPQTSNDGLLYYPPLNEYSLSYNNARLNLPKAKDWRSVELNYSIEPGEVLHFVINKVEDNAVILRLSRSPDYDHALLAYNDGMVSEKKPLPNLRPGEGGKLKFVKDNDGIQIVLDDENIAYPPLPQMSGDFEIALTPAGSIRLFDRVHVREVVLSDRGKAPRSYWRTIVFSLPFMALLAAGLAALLFWLLLVTGKLTRWLREFARPLLIFLFTLDALLVFTVFYFHYVFLDFLSPIFSSRFLIKALVVVFVIVSIALARLLPLALRVLRRRSWAKHPLFFPLLFAILTPLAVFLSIVLFFQFAKPAPTASEPPGRAETPRILCYGGSSTAGFPFEQNWEHSWPMVLQAIMRAEDNAATEMINLGVCARNMDYILDRLERDLKVYKPGVVIFDSVANNLRWPIKKFTVLYTRALALCRQYNARPVLVLEPSYVAVYHLPETWTKDQRRREELLPFYEELRRLAKENEALLVDPNPVFYQFRERFLFIDSRMHLTKYGHVLLAEVIAEALLGPRQ
ncbi:MAG TPA: SGNH/GDSL hydrolase family protein [bacterium]|nr:SGNH/GDSL hydrolase family protein [bacterium]